MLIYNVDYCQCIRWERCTRTRVYFVWLLLSVKMIYINTISCSFLSLRARVSQCGLYKLRQLLYVCKVICHFKITYTTNIDDVRDSVSLYPLKAFLSKRSIRRDGSLCTTRLSSPYSSFASPCIFYISLRTLQRHALYKTTYSLHDIWIFTAIYLL